MPAELTIEQLAAQSGMSVRNIRAHQARGLLDPPEVRLRVGYYRPEHVARLRLIRELQDEGFNLAGITRLIADRSGTLERIAELRHALTQPPRAEPPLILTVDELGRRFGLAPGGAPELLQSAERLGVVRELDDGRVEVGSPALLAAAQQVVESGISAAGALTIFAQVEAGLDAVSAAFVRLFVDEVWSPFQASGMPAARWDEIEAAIKRLLPLAGDVVSAAFAQRMGAKLDLALGRVRGQ